MKELPQEFHKTYRLLKINSDDLEMIYKNYMTAYNNYGVNARLITQDDKSILIDDAKDFENVYEEQKAKSIEPPIFKKFTIDARDVPGGSEQPHIVAESELELSKNKAEFRVSRTDKPEFYKLAHEVDDLLKNNENKRFGNVFDDILLTILTITLLSILAGIFLVFYFSMIWNQSVEPFTGLDFVMLLIIGMVVATILFFTMRTAENNHRRVLFYLMKNGPGIWETLYQNRKDVLMIIISAVAGGVITITCEIVAHRFGLI